MSTLLDYKPVFIPDSIIVIPGDYTTSTINKLIAGKIENYAASIFRRLCTKYTDYSISELIDILKITMLMNKEKIISKFEAEYRNIVTLFLTNIIPSYHNAE